MSLRVPGPWWGRAAAWSTVLVCALAAPALAQPKPEKTAAKADAPKKVKEQTFNFDGLGLNGRSRSPQLLYFLERANEELERASLEKRSFIPSIVKTVEDEAL